jgi:hypothetical protein
MILFFSFDCEIDSKELINNEAMVEINIQNLRNLILPEQQEV